MLRKRIVFLIIILSLTGIFFNTVSGQEVLVGRVIELFPNNNLQKTIDELKPGDQLILHEGTYEGSLIVEVSGIPGFPITIKGYGNGEKRPIIFYQGTKANLTEVAGNHLVFDYIEFQSPHTYAIRLGRQGIGVHDITIQHSVFTECGGGDISANSYNVPYDNIQILNNFFNGTKVTPVYIGSHPGSSPVTHFIFKGNVIDGSQNDGPENTIGYGIELKMNVVKSIIEDNFITGTKGPGIMVYGSDKAASYGNFNAVHQFKIITTNAPYANIVRNNIVIGTRKNPGIVVGGGPSIVQDNVVINCNGGISVSNYAHRNLLEGITVSNNTVIQDNQTGISYGEAQLLIDGNNLVISSNKKNTFEPDQKATGDLYMELPPTMKKEIKEISNLVPAFENLNTIFRQISSGPVRQKSIEELFHLIKRNATTVKKKRG